MKKNLFLLAAAALTFAACSNDEYLGTAPAGVQEGQGGAIMFSGKPANISRAATQSYAGADAAQKLGYKFNVVGTKTVTNNGSDVIKSVFAQGEYAENTGIADANAYKVWYKANSAGTTSNTANWDYVGEGEQGTDGYKTPSNMVKQTIKYWDYAATQYDFVAYSATKGGTVGNIQTKHDAAPVLTFTGTPAQLAAFYVADHVTVEKPISGQKYKNGPVVFTFSAAGSMVRLGIYETIPGYDVKNITFRPISSNFTETKQNAILNGKFIGDANANSVFELTYAIPESPVLIFKDQQTSQIRNNYDFGTFSSTDFIGKESTNPTWADGTNYVDKYLPVFPTSTNSLHDKMTLYVNYELHALDNSGEVITVTGAKAVVPASYMEWKANHKYTYLFKISDNTNGTTGTENSDLAGLYPITFDAAVEEPIAGNDDEHGTITTVSEYAITTYQNGSVVNNGVEYHPGNIGITVTTNNSVYDITESTLKVYDITSNTDVTTEADLALITNYDTYTDKSATVASNVASFTAEANKTYAVVLNDGNTPAKNIAYKLIKVVPAPTVAP